LTANRKIYLTQTYYGKGDKGKERYGNKLYLYIQNNILCPRVNTGVLI